MNKGFWAKLKKPLFVLAPMADVTDSAFRKIIAKYGKPDVVWTEFTSADGLSSPGRKILLNNLIYSEAERPIVAQLFGAHPDKMREAAALVQKLGFDGLDINMGCPDKAMEKQGAGAAMIKDPSLAKEIIRAAREGAPNLPVSVKTRLGFNKVEMNWLEELLKENLPVLTVHLRTRKEMSKVPAHWELMRGIVELRNKISPETLIIGNGDVVDTDDARRKCEETGCDGVMLGKAIFGNPFLFSKKASPLEIFSSCALPGVPGGTLGDKKFQEAALKKKLKVMLEHTRLFEKLLGKVKSFAVMKKHYKAYVNGFDGAKELRIKLMEAKDYAEVEHLVNGFLVKL